MLDVAALCLDGDNTEILQNRCHQIGACILDPDLGIGFQFDSFATTDQPDPAILGRTDISIGGDDFTATDLTPGPADLLGDFTAHPVHLPIIGENRRSSQEHQQKQNDSHNAYSATYSRCRIDQRACQTVTAPDHKCTIAAW